MSLYRRYAGGPDPLAPPVDLSEALDAIGEDVMAGYSPERAMREFLRRGGRDQAGLDELAARIARKRRELTGRHNLDGTLAEVRDLLDHAVLEERKQLARDLDDGARFAEMQLAQLSPALQPQCPSWRPTSGAAPRLAPTTSRSKTCSGENCSTSGSPG